MSLAPSKTDLPRVGDRTDESESITSHDAVDETFLAKSPSNERHLNIPSARRVRSVSPGNLSLLSVSSHGILDTGFAEEDEPASHGFLQGWREDIRAFWHRNIGLALVLLSQFFGTCMNITTRILELEGNNGKGLHPFQVLFARMTITLTLSSLYMWYRKTPHFPLGVKEVRWLLVARGFGGFFGVFGLYYSLVYLDLSDATVLTFLAPSLACWACSILLKQPFTRMEQIAALVSLLGVVLIARPTSFFGSANDPPPAAGNGEGATGEGAVHHRATPAERLSAVGVAMLGVMGAATAYTTIRWIGKRAHPLITVNYFAAWCTIVSTTALTFVPSIPFALPSGIIEWSYLIFLGVCGFAMQFLLAAGLQAEKSSRATNMVYVQMLFALLADRIVFGQSPAALSLVGGAMILGSAIYVAVKKEEVKKEDRGSGTADEERGLVESMEDREVRPGQWDDPGSVIGVPLRTLR